MKKFVPVAKVLDIPEDEAISVRVGDEQIAIFNVGGEFYAISDLCAHAGGPISSGWVTDGRVTCPWHGWQFELAPQSDPSDGMRRYPVKIEGDQILIEIEE